MKTFLLLGFGVVGGIKTPALSCLKLTGSLCECSGPPSMGCKIKNRTKWLHLQVDPSNLGDCEAKGLRGTNRHHIKQYVSY